MLEHEDMSMVIWWCRQEKFKFKKPSKDQSFSPALVFPSNQYHYDDDDNDNDNDDIEEEDDDNNNDDMIMLTYKSHVLRLWSWSLLVSHRRCICLSPSSLFDCLCTQEATVCRCHASLEAAACHFPKIKWCFHGLNFWWFWSLNKIS